MTTHQRTFFGSDEAVERDRWAPLFSAKTDEHPTPAEVVACWSRRLKAHGITGGFTLDVAATEENAKAPRFYTLAGNGLAQDWYKDAAGGAAWMNPPYSECLRWVAKALEESARGLWIVALLPARTDTAWFHELLEEQHRCDLVFLRGRLRFGDARASAPFPSVVVIFRPGAKGTAP